MKKLLIFLVLVGFTQLGYSQSLIQTFTDRCTGETKVFSIAMQGTTTVVFYNKSRTFTAGDVQSGVFQAWLEETYAWWLALSPCSTNQSTTTNTQTTTQQTTSNATTAANNAASSTASTANTGGTASTASTADTTGGTTSTETTNTNTNDTSNANSSTETSSTDQGATSNSESTGNTSEGSSTSDNSSDTSSGDSNTGDSSGDGDGSTGDSSGGSEGGNTEEGGSTGDGDSSEGGSGETSEEGSGDSENKSEDSKDNESTEEKSESESEKQEDKDSDEEVKKEEESKEEEKKEEEKKEEESEEEKKDEDKEESDEESEEDSEEESDEEESDDEESEDEEEEDSEEEGDNEEEEEDDKNKKKKRNLAPPIISANLMAMQMLDGTISTAASFGVSQSSLTGVETYSLNTMIWSNLKQFMIGGGISTVYFKYDRKQPRMLIDPDTGKYHEFGYTMEKGSIWSIDSHNVNFMYMFGTKMVSYTFSQVYMGQKDNSWKGFVGGYAMTNSLILLPESTMFSPSLTIFGTKPVSFKALPRWGFSPMAAVSLSPLQILNTKNEYSKDRLDTVWNKQFTFILGSSANFKITQRFVANLGVTAIGNSDPVIPITFAATIGSRFAF